MAIDQYPIFELIPEGPLSITCSTIRIAAANARGDGGLGTSFEAYFSRSQLNAQPGDARERPTNSLNPMSACLVLVAPSPCMGAALHRLYASNVIGGAPLLFGLGKKV